MERILRNFDFTYNGQDILFGRGRVAELSDVLAERDFRRALIVCGSNVGANDDLMNPIRDGLGNRFVGIFDETTPIKRIETAYKAIDRMREVDADILIGIGGGSSLDVARQMAALAADGRSEDEIKSAAMNETVIRLDKTANKIPVIVIPTTFAGADVSESGSLVVLPAEHSPTGQPITISETVMPIANIADPAVFETTPLTVLEGSAMNGLDKGIETLYARDGNPFSDATAIHGLRYLFNALPNISSDDTKPIVIDRAVLGMLLVQYERKASIIHAFGHAFARRYPVQQGHVHAVMAPHVLRYVLEQIEGIVPKLAESVGVDPHDGSSAIGNIVDKVTSVRNSLDVPRNARDLPGAEYKDIPRLAKFVLDDRMMSQCPVGLELSAENLESILEAAW